MYDYAVVGGGIVGLATAMKLLERRPDARVLLLEKENQVGRHQTGHNSGVIHSGLYYAPGSLKADLCRRGAAATTEFCERHGIPVKALGKLLVATDERDLARMADLTERAARNGVEVERVSADGLRELEPNVVGLGALLVPSTGVVDYRQVCEAMRREVAASGGEIELGAEVTGIHESAAGVTVTAGERHWTAGRLVVCAGLQSDRLARLAGVRSKARIVPFRGEYYRLREDVTDIVDRLIYPVPDPSLPFLGVHLTPMVDGSVTVGPNAVLGLAREGYRKWSVNARDVADLLAFPGLWRVAAANVGTGALELRNSLFKRGYLAQCRRYCPALELEHLQSHEAGIRAQAVLPDGTLVHDFLLEQTPRTLHVINAPSPAATSAIPIGELIADRCLAAVT